MFTENMDGPGKTTFPFVQKEKVTILVFLQGTVNLFCFNIISV